MKGKTLKIDSQDIFAVKIDNMIRQLEEMLVVFKDLKNASKIVQDKSGIAKASINALLVESELSVKERRVLSYILKAPRTRSELSIRFAKVFTSKDLYGEDGVIPKMITLNLIERKLEETQGRPVTFFKVTEAMRKISKGGSDE